MLNKGKTQVIFETRDEDLEVVLKIHSDMRERYTVLDIQEPQENQLNEIIHKITQQRLEKFHEIKVSDEAIQLTIDLTTKYRVRDMGLSLAQPACSISLLDRALTSYRQEAHSKDPRITALEFKKADLLNQINNNDLESSKKAILQQEQQVIDTQIAELKELWQQRQRRIKSLYADMRDGEKSIRTLENQLELQIKKQKETQSKVIAQAEERGEVAPSFESFSLASDTLESDAVVELKEKNKAL